MTNLSNVFVLRGSAERDAAGPMGRAWWCWWPYGRIERGRHTFFQLSLYWLRWYFVLLVIDRRCLDEEETPP